MSEREQIEHAIAAVEAQRAMLGEAATEAALTGLRQKLVALDEEPRPRPSPGADAGERKLVTIMFADISGFTALSETMDPEAVRDLMNTCFERLVPCITRYEGTVDKFIGDEIMALFGAPLAHENDAERAVRAALDMMTALSAFNAERHINLGLHFGLNTGLVLAGSLGAGGRQDYSVMGDAVNLASRLEDASESGQIFVGPDTYRLTVQLFEFETLVPIKVKGKAEPVAAYRVIGLKAKPGRVRGLETQGISSPLVGRAKEFDAVKAGVEQLVVQRRGGIIGIIGEAGLGKSRLVAEILTGATHFGSASHLLWLEGHTLSFGQTISYWPFQQILRGWAGITEDDDEDKAWRKLEGQVRALFGAATIDYLPYLASLLALTVQGEYVERVKYLDGEAMGKQIFLTSRRFFERLAQTQPTVLVFEDLHWMDESSANLLEHLLPLVESAPLLVIGLSRPERGTPGARLQEVAAHTYADRYTELRLAALSGADSAQLVRNLLEIEALPDRVREMIVRKADGNPFFLEEVIRTLIDAGAVKRDPASGRWRATAQIETLTIPDTIQGVIMARVDRLEEDVKQVLRTAAVVGRAFFYRVLKAVAEADKTLDASLAELQAIELIREKQIAPELEYIFKHALAQEATYASILQQKRRDLHTRVGQAIEALFADRLEEFYGLLAHHYAKAEQWEKAQDYLLKAGDQAGKMAADAEALAHYEQAIAAYARAFGDKWDPRQRASLERKMGEAFWRRGEYPQAAEHFRRGLAYLGYRLPMTRGEVQRGLVRELLEQVGHRLLPRLFLKPTATLASPAVEDEAYIYFDMSTGIDLLTNSERSLLLTLRLLNLSERRGYPLGVILASCTLGLALTVLGLSRLGGWYGHYALTVALKLQLPATLGNAYFGLQIQGIFSGALDQSLVHGRQAVQAFHEAGESLNVGAATSFLAWASIDQGKLADGLAHSGDTIRLGQDTGARNVWCWGETQHGYALRRLGRLAEAIAHQQKAIELAEAVPDYVYRILAGAELGLCYLRQGDYDRAVAELELCQRVAAEHPLIPYSQVTTLNNLAEAHLLAAEHGDPAHRAMRLRQAQEACRAALKHAPKFQVKQPKAMRLQGTYEWLNGKPANAQKWWHKSLAEAERMGLRYDVGEIYLEMGQRLNERAHLEKAEALFAEIGAEWDLARTRECLRISAVSVNGVRE